MSNEQFELALAATAVTDQASACYLRQRDKTQREAITRLMVERDMALDAASKGNDARLCEVLSNE